MTVQQHAETTYQTAKGRRTDNAPSMIAAVMNLLAFSRLSMDLTSIAGDNFGFTPTALRSLNRRESSAPAAASAAAVAAIICSGADGEFSPVIM